MTTIEALAGAIAMLDSVAAGKSYDRRQWHENMAAIRGAYANELAAEHIRTVALRRFPWIAENMRESSYATSTNTDKSSEKGR